MGLIEFDISRMPANSEKEHLSIVICGHVDAGKSTTTGRLIFELGGIPERDMQKLKEEAERLGKASFAFAFYMDRQKEEREREVTIACTTKEFYTEKWHYTIIDAPGHRDFIKNMITGASQADVALIMVPADGNFATAIAKGNPKAGEVMGQTRQHSLLINLLGVKQIVVAINKMDCDVAKYGEARYTEIRDEVMGMLQILHHPGELKVGYTPIGFVRTGRSAVKMTKIDWKIGKETGGQKLEDPPMLKANEVAQCTFEPQQPFVVDTFKNCEGLGRIAIMEGNTVVMLGKIVSIERAPEKK